MKKRKLLIGYDDFRKLIEDDGYFVDKSLLIKELIDNSSEVTLITRPRRFGKTLNISMLKWFWENPECRVSEQKYHRKMDHLFSDLAIKQAGKEYLKEQGAFPVVFLSFRGAKRIKWEDTALELKNTISYEYTRHRYLLESSAILDSEKQYIKQIISREAPLSEYANALFNLTHYLHAHFSKNVIVLIDEYDTPIQQGYLSGYFDEVIDFFRTFLVKGLKGNDALKRAVVTGIMKVAQESVFSSFNNPNVCTITNSIYADKFGFTEPEVKELLETFDLGDHFNDVKTWYNGYIFGRVHDIYNPWSIIKYICDSDRMLQAYWVNTGGTELIQDVLQIDKLKSKETLEKLIKGEELREVLIKDIVYQNIKSDPRTGFNFLLQCGYLKASDPQQEDGELKYLIQIPNKEILSLIKNMVKTWFNQNWSKPDLINYLVKSLKEENWPLFEDRLKNIFFRSVSYYDTAKPSNTSEEETESIKYENFYHGLFLGLLVQMQSQYIIKSNREYGLGRPDLVLLPYDKKQTAVIFEFKAVKTSEKESPVEAARDALEQCDEKKYKAGLKADGYDRVKIIGIGFKGKELKIKWV